MCGKSSVDPVSRGRSALTALVCHLFLWGRVMAADVTDLTWTTDGSEVTITDCDTAATGSLVIPATLGGDPVRIIGPFAFSQCTGLTSITLPDGVTTFEVSAFRSCTGLNSIVIPDSVTTVGSYSFISCTGLTSVTLGSGVQTIGQRAFYRCTDLPTITLPAGVMQVAEDSFSQCDSLTNILVAAGNTAYQSVGGVLFTSGPTELIAYPNGRAGPYVIPAGVQGVGSEAFIGSDLLTEVTVPDSVTNIGFEAFGGCPGLMDFVVAPSNPAYQDIGGVLFNKAGTLLHSYPGGRTGPYAIPPGVTAVADFSFKACALSSVSFPPSLTQIRYEAFQDCRSLSHLFIPDTVTLVDWGAFSNCRAMTSVRLPAGLTEVATYLFYSCDALQSITLPAGVTSIGYGAFSNSEVLTTIVFEGPAPTTTADSFQDLGPNPLAMVTAANAASFGGFGATWNGLLVVEVRDVRIVKAGMFPGTYYIDVADSTAGLKVTASPDLETAFADLPTVIAVNDDGGQPRRFLIPMGDLPAGDGYLRVELDL